MFDKIASLFVEVDKEPEKKEEPASEEKGKGNGGAATAPVSTSPAVSAPPPVIPATVNEGMVDLLSQAIEAANIDGFDYIEFRDALVRMASVPMPEQQKFQAVFATACSMGVTKESLISSIDHYLEVIGGKKSEFGAHVENMLAQEVTSREQSVEQKEQEIAALSEQIQQATAAINEKQREILQLKNEINEHKLNIQQTNSSFEATYNFVAGKLQEDKGKIQNYLIT